MRLTNPVLIGGIILLALLAIKSLKQFILLSFTLLSMKLVWMLVVLVFIVGSAKKYARSVRDPKRR